jgi:hypothetical protein
MPHLPPVHHEISKHDSPNETKIKDKQNKTIPDSNSNLAKSITHHNQTKELTTWFLIVADRSPPDRQRARHPACTARRDRATAPRQQAGPTVPGLWAKVGPALCPHFLFSISFTFLENHVKFKNV